MPLQHNLNLALILALIPKFVTSPDRPGNATTVENSHIYIYNMHFNQIKTHNTELLLPYRFKQELTVIHTCNGIHDNIQASHKHA
jgi:hypothetical protein